MSNSNIYAASQPTILQASGMTLDSNGNLEETEVMVIPPVEQQGAVTVFAKDVIPERTGRLTSRLGAAAGGEAHLRDLGRLAGARLAGEDHHLVLLDGRDDFLRAGADRQRRGEIEAEVERSGGGHGICLTQRPRRRAEDKERG